MPGFVAELRFPIPTAQPRHLNQVILLSVTLRPVVIGDASSLALLSHEVWSWTYLRHGITVFFVDYALDDFTKDRFEGVLQDPLEVILVLEKSRGIRGYIRLSLNSECGIEGCGVVEIKTLYFGPITSAAALVALCWPQRLPAVRRWTILVYGWRSAQNNAPINFYKAQEFSRIGQGYFSIGDARFLNHVLALDVPAWGDQPNAVRAQSQVTFKSITRMISGDRIEVRRIGCRLL